MMRTTALPATALTADVPVFVHIIQRARYLQEVPPAHCQRQPLRVPDPIKHVSGLGRISETSPTGGRGVLAGTARRASLSDTGSPTGSASLILLGTPRSLFHPPIRLGHEHDPATLLCRGAVGSGFGIRAQYHNDHTAYLHHNTPSRRRPFLGFPSRRTCSRVTTTAAV